MARVVAFTYKAWNSAYPEIIMAEGVADRLENSGSAL
jgi:hypothetical protein